MQKLEPIIWRLSKATLNKFQHLLKQLEGLNEDSSEAHAVRDDIRSLPGFPTHNHPDRHVIHFEVTTVS